MDRPRWWRQRILRYPSSHKLHPPNGPIRAPLHPLHPRNIPLHLHHHPNLLLNRRQIRRRIPRHPARRRHPNPLQPPDPNIRKILQPKVPKVPSTLVPNRITIHDFSTICESGRTSSSSDCLGCSSCRTVNSLFRDCFLFYAFGDVSIGIWI